MVGSESMRILNALRCGDFIDRSRTVGSKWEPSDGRPDKVGFYRMIARLFIDPTLAEGAHLFRLSGWKTPLIASEWLVSKLVPADLEGVALQPVT